MTGPARNSDATPGFTLIELMIVLVLVGIVAAIAFPKIDSMRYRVDGGVRVVQAMMQQGHRLAIQRQHDVLFSVDVAGGRVRLVEDRNNNGAADAGERVVWRSLEQGLLFSRPSRGVNGPVTDAFVGPRLRALDLPTLIFRRSGSVSSEAQLYLTSARGVTTDFRAVLLTQSTGRTASFQMKASGWQPGIR